MEKNVNREPLVDKLCERLAIEEAGVRLYRALLDQILAIDTAGQLSGLVPRLHRFQDDEAQHCKLLREMLEAMGVDDFNTPSARLARAEGEAFGRLIAEAQTPSQLLHVLLTVELMDESAWELLVNLAHDVGDEAMSAAFAAALKREKEHLYKIRGEVARLLREEVEPTAPEQK